MNHEFDPKRLNVVVFAQSGGNCSGAEPLRTFERLVEENGGLAGETTVSFSSQGSSRLDPAGIDEPWLHLSASTTLAQVCQRCMGAVDVLVHFERDFRFVASEALAEVEDEESEEDVLVISKGFNLLELIEDELLMAMPPVPMHAVCPKQVKLLAVDPNFEALGGGLPNPFAALQSLKKKDSGQL